jgi:general secretion pathway protein D
VQYVDTGTIMSIKPVIHSSDQVDLDVLLESSQPGQVTANAPQSQPISKRTVETKLTLQHGSTYVLGGLIRDNNTVSTTGVPFLKDIPILGRAFKTDVRNKDRVELIIMITPYIMSDDSEARSVTEAVKKQLGGWASDVQLNNATPLVTPKSDGK